MMYGIILLLLFQLSWSLPDITIPAGSSLTLPCMSVLSDDLFFPKFNWTFTPEKDRQDLRHEHWLDRSSAELKLHEVGLQDAGKYTCMMEGQSGDGLMKLERSFTLHIQEIPLLMKRLVVTVMEREAAMLPCRAAVTSGKAGSAQPSWHRVMEGSAQQELHPGFKIESSSNKEDMASNRIYWTSNPKEQDWSITIASVRLDDSGLYNCEVHGVKEKEIVSVQLIVDSLQPSLCPDHSQAWEACPDPDNRSWKATVSEALTAFSVNVYSTLKKTHATHNMLFSPASIGGLLSYLLLGARGKTRTELESALSLPTEFSCIHEMMRNIRNETKESMHMAYKMFYNPVYELRETFISQSLEFYGTQPGKLTNSSEKNVKMVNDWVANKTHNRITKLLESVEEDTQVVLLSAVHFSGKWSSSFNVKTKLDNFTTLSGEKVSVPVLYSSRFELAISYKTFLKAQVARFPLKGKSSLYILLPATRSEKAFTLVEDSLTETTVRTMVTEMESLPLVSSEVTLPKIKLTLNTDLISLLKKLGLFDLFDEPDLCGMITGKSAMFLTDARHRAYMSLTEKGVEAAAATSISFSRSFSTFSAMKPFIFIVWSEVSKCPLFMGRVLNPQYKD